MGFDIGGDIGAGTSAFSPAAQSFTPPPSTGFGDTSALAPTDPLSAGNGPAGALAFGATDTSGTSDGWGANDPGAASLGSMNPDSPVDINADGGPSLGSMNPGASVDMTGADVGTQPSLGSANPGAQVNMNSPDFPNQTGQNNPSSTGNNQNPSGNQSGTGNNNQGNNNQNNQNNLAKQLGQILQGAQRLAQQNQGGNLTPQQAMMMARSLSPYQHFALRQMYTQQMAAARQAAWNAGIKNPQADSRYVQMVGNIRQQVMAQASNMMQQNMQQLSPLLQQAANTTQQGDQQFNQAASNLMAQLITMGGASSPQSSSSGNRST